MQSNVPDFIDAYKHELGYASFFIGLVLIVGTILWMNPREDVGAFAVATMGFCLAIVPASLCVYHTLFIAARGSNEET